MTDRLSALREAVDDLHRWEFSGEWESFNDTHPHPLTLMSAPLYAAHR